MNTVTYRYEQLERFCRDVFIHLGFSSEEAGQITDVLLLADLYGITSHGMHRLIRYRNSIRRGSVKIDAKPEVVFETPVSAVIDGHDGIGQRSVKNDTLSSFRNLKKIYLDFIVDFYYFII